MTRDPLDSLRDATAGLRGQASGALEGLTQVRPSPPPPSTPPKGVGGGGDAAPLTGQPGKA